MMDGVISGKTGFTGDAGYCYVGALKREDRTFVVALLGCGWPNNKTYKWADTRKLMNYGIENFKYRDIEKKQELKPKEVEGGIPKSGSLKEKALLHFEVKQGEKERMLLGNEEEIQVKMELKKDWRAPVKKGEKAGKVMYCLGNQVLKEYEIVTANEIEKLTYGWCLEKIARRYIAV